MDYDSTYLHVMDYIWKYFELHANQRIALFRYYMIFITIYIYGVGYLAVRFPGNGNDEELLAILISTVFIFITCTFRRLDLRNRQLIHYAEAALRYLESNFKSTTMINERSFNDVNEIKIFTHEFNEKYKKHSCTGHTDCFKRIFWCANTAAALFIFVALIRLGVVHLAPFCKILG